MWEADATAHPAFRQGLQETDQIACGSGFGGRGVQWSDAVPAQRTVEIL
jgi:hypothetical protein